MPLPCSDTTSGQRTETNCAERPLGLLTAALEELRALMTDPTQYSGKKRGRGSVLVCALWVPACCHHSDRGWLVTPGAQCLAGIQSDGDGGLCTVIPRAGPEGWGYCHDAGGWREASSTIPHMHISTQSIHSRTHS